MATGTLDGVDIELAPSDRIRSPGDVLRLLSGLVVLGVGILLALFFRNTIGGAEEDLAEQLADLPSRWEQVILAGVEIALITATVGIAIFLTVTRRRRLLLWLVGTVLSASVLTTLLGLWLTNSNVEVIAGVNSVGSFAGSNPSFPGSGLLAGVTAALVFGSPWLTSRWRRTGWAVLAVLVLIRVGFSADPSADVVAAIGLGIVVGSAMLLLRGAPSLEPSAPELLAALRDTGITPTAVRQVAPGHTTLTYRVSRDDGDDIHLGLRTPHDRSADALTHMWKSIRLRPDAVDAPFNTIRQRVEHEALSLELARRSGARVPALIGMLAAGEESVGVLEEQVDGTPLAGLGSAEGGTTNPRSGAATEVVTDSVLADIWQQVGLLHNAGIAHRGLVLDRVIVDSDGAAWLTGFHRARLATTAREKALDVAQLLADTALLVGPERAVDAVVDALGPEAAATAYPLLQPLALPQSTRREMRGRGDLLEELRSELQLRCHIEGEELERIERVRPRTVVTIVALTLAFYLVLPQLADLRSTADAFVAANWAWAPAIIIGSAASYLFAAVSFTGAVPDVVPYLGALRQELAASFVSLIAPANTGGLAIGVRFLQRSGVASAPAAASVALNTGAGLIVHVALLLVAILWTGRADVGDFSLPDLAVVAAIAAVVLALAGLALLNRRVRERVLGPLREAMRSAADSLARVFRNPVRVLQLFGGSMGVTLSYLFAMVAAVEAFGGGPTVPQIAVGYLLASALASVAPTPGGLGAFEAAMIATLAGFGMSSGAAVSATLAFRLATYWLPILPGWISFTWMQHHDEL